MGTHNRKTNITIIQFDKVSSPRLPCIRTRWKIDKPKHVEFNTSREGNEHQVNANKESSKGTRQAPFVAMDQQNLKISPSGEMENYN